MDPLNLYREKGIFMAYMVGERDTCFNYLYRDRLFMSFEDLKKLFHLTDKGDFWKYLQLRSSVGSVFGLIRDEEEENKIQEFLNSPHTLHSASLFYRNISNIQIRLCEALRKIWQKDLGSEIREDLWQDIISNVGWATRDTRSKLSITKLCIDIILPPLNCLKWA